MPDHSKVTCSGPGYAIAAFKTLPGTLRPFVVGHPPREISRFTYPQRVSIMQIHQRSPWMITTGSWWSRNSYTTDGYYEAKKEQRTGDEKIQRVGE